MILRQRKYLESAETNLSYLLLPRGKTHQIGAEKGRIKTNGIARYDSPHGSYRYVMYKKGEAVAALQIMYRTGGKALVSNVFVKKENRRKGYATALLKKAKKDFGKVNLSKGRSKLGAAWASVNEMKYRSFMRYCLTEMAEIPSLVSLQRKGNKKPATKVELRYARKRALQCRNAQEAYLKAKKAWQFMYKREIIQVYLDREAKLLGLDQLPPKPVFLDAKRVKWSVLKQYEVKAAIKWIARKSEDQIKNLLKRAKQSNRLQKTEDSVVRIEVYTAAMKEWKRLHKEWRKRANRIQKWFG